MQSVTDVSLLALFFLHLNQKPQFTNETFNMVNKYREYV